MQTRAASARVEMVGGLLFWVERLHVIAKTSMTIVIGCNCRACSEEKYRADSSRRLLSGSARRRRWPWFAEAWPILNSCALISCHTDYVLTFQSLYGLRSTPMNLRVIAHALFPSLVAQAAPIDTAAEPCGCTCCAETCCCEKCCCRGEDCGGCCCCHGK
jgi:hypothetical protein